MVGGATGPRIASIEKIASTGRRAQQMPMQDLVEESDLGRRIADDALTAPISIDRPCRGAVGVDVIDVVRREAGALDGEFMQRNARRRPRMVP